MLKAIVLAFALVIMFIAALLIVQGVLYVALIISEMKKANRKPKKF